MRRCRFPGSLLFVEISTPRLFYQYCGGASAVLNQRRGPCLELFFHPLPLLYPGALTGRFNPRPPVVSSTVGTAKVLQYSCEPTFINLTTCWKKPFYLLRKLSNGIETILLRVYLLTTFHTMATTPVSSKDKLIQEHALYILRALQEIQTQVTVRTFGLRLFLSTEEFPV